MSASARDEKSWAVASVIWIPEPAEPAAAEPLPAEPAPPRLRTQMHPAHSSTSHRTNSPTYRRRRNRRSIFGISIRRSDVRAQRFSARRNHPPKRILQGCPARGQGPPRRRSARSVSRASLLSSSFVSSPGDSQCVATVRTTPLCLGQHPRRQNVTILTPYGKRGHPPLPETPPPAASVLVCGQPGSNVPTWIERPIGSRRHPA